MAGAFVRPGIMGSEPNPVFENLASMAAGMAAGKVYKIMTIHCPHRRKLVLQQVHDNDSRLRPAQNDNSDDDERQTEQPQPAAASNADD